MDYAHTHLANNVKSAKGGGERQFNGHVDVYKRHLHLMVLLDFTVALFLQLLVSSSTVVFTSVYTTPSVCIVVISTYHSLTFFAEPVVLVGALEGSFLASFGLGWGVTIGAGLASYPLDTIRQVSYCPMPVLQHLLVV